MATTRNTLQKGTVRYIVYREGNMWFGVALEFNIVETGDDPQEVTFLLFEAIQGYVESMKKIRGLRDFGPLNQKPNKEYNDLWKQARNRKSIPSPYKVHSYGERVLA